MQQTIVSQDLFLSPVSPFATFSPFFEQKQCSFEPNPVIAGGDHPFHSLLSPSSPPKMFLMPAQQTGTELDQAFAQLISDTPTTSVTELVPNKKKVRPPPLMIPQPPQQAQQQQAAMLVQDESNNEDRKWNCVFLDASYASLLRVQVTSKTRCEEPSEEVPDKLYSSLKYELRIQATGAICEQVPFLLARCTLVDAVEFAEVLKDSKSALKGVVEGSIVKPPATTEQKLEGSLKVQCLDVSYHHKKRGFCFQIAFYVPSNLDVPVMVMRSASFLVYARKPSQGKKRKHADIVADTFGSFASKLDELVQCSKRMKPNERRTALEMVSSKMLELDPAYFIAQLSKLQQHQMD